MIDVWRGRFGGQEASRQETAADPLKADPGAKKSSKKVATPISNGPKSPEALALEAKITEQGNHVRELKAQKPKTPELDAQIKDAVNVLKKLKADLEVELQKS